MVFYANPVSDALSGTCQGSDVLTVSLSDPKNDFYDGVDVDVKIDTVARVATSVVMDLGQDAESGTHRLTFSATASSPGTRVKVVISGASYSLTGVLQDLEKRHGKKTTSLIPFSLKVVCSA